MKLKTLLTKEKSPLSLNSFFGDDNDNFLLTCYFLSLSEDNNEFVSFLSSDMGQNIMTNNSLSIYIETGDIFYNDFSTKENFYNFLLTQQDELKQFIPKQISYHYSFEKYTRSYLLSFSLEEIDELDLLSNKNAKYLLYTFNDWIESMGAERILIRHTSKVRDKIGLQENRGKR